MASIDTSYNSSFGGQYPVRVCEATLTVAAAGTSATFTSSSKFRGTIEKIELDPGTVTENATIKGYEANTDLATGTRDHFLNYTVPASEVELVFYPVKPLTTNAGVAVSYADGYPAYGKYVVNDQLRIDLASATAADSVTIRIYVRG